MKKKDFIALKKGEKIIHKHYGLCTIVDEIKEFEAKTIRPDTDLGKQTLVFHSGVPISDLLEDSYRLCKIP
jgi:hypothetical protein